MDWGDHPNMNFFYFKTYHKATNFTNFEVDLLITIISHQGEQQFWKQIYQTYKSALIGLWKDVKVDVIICVCNNFNQKNIDEKFLNLKDYIHILECPDHYDGLTEKTIVSFHLSLSVTSYICSLHSFKS